MMIMDKQHNTTRATMVMDNNNEEQEHQQQHTISSSFVTPDGSETVTSVLFRNTIIFDDTDDHHHPQQQNISKLNLLLSLLFNSMQNLFVLLLFVCVTAPLPFAVLAAATTNSGSIDSVASTSAAVASISSGGSSTSSNTNIARITAKPTNEPTESPDRIIISQLKDMYKTKVQPVEMEFDLYNFCLPTNGPIADQEFDTKPMVLLLGQYSTGKTTFIRHLIGCDFPGMHIGPEPTTDRFMAVVHGNNKDEAGLKAVGKKISSWMKNIRVPTSGDKSKKSKGGLDDDLDEDDDDDGFDIDYGYGGLASPSSVSATTMTEYDAGHDNKILKGNTLTVTPELPFSTLSAFGTNFLSHFVGSVCPAPLLQHIMLVDTPGVLSGEKQRIARSYDFAKVVRWFADRSDLILLLFDAHKLDISDELKDVIETIRPYNDDKMRCVLNKSDGVTKEQLVRVYGSLMFSIGKIFHTPEVVRVYTGSYWDGPLLHDDFADMFDADERLLLQELINLPTSSAQRKVNEVVKRIRIIKVHLCILSYLKQKMPFLGKQKKRDKLITNLDKVFDHVRVEYGLSEGDMPDVNQFRACLEDYEDFSQFPIVKKQTLRMLDTLIDTDIPEILKGAGWLSPATASAFSAATGGSSSSGSAAASFSWLGGLQSNKSFRSNNNE